MSRPSTPIQGLLRALRIGMAQALETDRSPLLLLARQALTFIEQGNPGDPDVAGESSELAYLLAGLVAADLGPLAGEALGLLFRLGVVGEILAAAALETSPMEQALDLAEHLGDEEKLLFVNAFFRRPRPTVPQLADFCQTVLAKTAERSPDELLVLLDLLASRLEIPSLPLRNALTRGRLGIWLQRLLLLPLSADQARYLACVIGRLRDPDLAERLAAGIGDMDSVTAEIVCRALAEIPGLGAWAASAPLEGLLADEDPLLAIAALAVLGRCDETRAVRKVAVLAKAHPERVAELAPALAGFSQAGFRLLMQTVPPDLRPEMLRAIYRILASAMPWRLAAAARAIGQDPRMAPLIDALRDDLAARRKAIAPFVRPPRPVRPAPSAGSASTALEEVKYLVDLPTNDEAATVAAVLLQELRPGVVTRDRTIAHTGLGGASIAEVSFVQCRLQGVSLAAAELRGCVFEETRFSHVDFSQARFDNTAFRNCRFDNCRFAAAMLRNVRFQGCRLRLCDCGGIVGRDVSLIEAEADACNFDRAVFAGLQAIRCSLRAVNLTRAVVRGGLCQGTAFTDCILESADLADTELASATTDGCYLAGLRLDGTTDAPDILAAVEQTEARLMAETATDIPMPDTLAVGPGLRFVGAVLDAAFCSRDIRQRRTALLANNKRRMALAQSRLGTDNTAFLELLPELIAAGAVRDETGLHPAPVARIAGYDSTLSSRRLLTAHLGADYAKLPPSGIPVDVKAVYAVGSIGTVAQTAGSDLDVWLCLDTQNVKSPQVAAFEEKLDAISRMAGRERGLDLHFFCMTAKDIRDNIFGFSPDEGQGSAQGCLLKEEFYRTVLVVAGRKPFWWCVAPGATPEVYERTLADIARTESGIAADCLDCGSIGSIAGDEYFGASLWMIVKSLTSPFKSILKFGLLEKYAEKAARPELLCETVKASLIAGQTGLWQCDPYALLFSEVSRYYVKQDQMGALALLRKAFQQKIGFDPYGEYGGRSGAAILDRFFPYAPQPAGTCPAHRLPKQDESKSGFPQVVALGDAITKYFLHVYKRLRQRADQLPSQGGLTERDQAMLSQRITASFSRETGKIMRLPFIRPGRDLFLSLEIDHEERGPRERAFVIRGETETKREDDAEKWDPIRMDTSLVRLAAWLAANELYRPGERVRAVFLPPPLSLPDAVGLFDTIYATFPIRETFAPPLSWGLSPKAITAALIVLNLGVARDEREVVRAEVLYATSWGELLHFGTPKGLSLLESNVAAFLTGNLGLPLAPDARIEAFAPARSQCRAARHGRFGR